MPVVAQLNQTRPRAGFFAFWLGWNMKTETKLKRLTARQRKLVDTLMTHENITQQEAGVIAGFSSAMSNGAVSKTLALPHVRAYYDEQLAKRAKRTGIDADYVLKRLADIDQMDIADLYDDEGNILPIREWPKIWRQNVKEIDLKNGKIKVQDKLRTLELIGKHVGVRAFTEQIEVTDTAGIAERMMKARKRAAEASQE